VHCFAFNRQCAQCQSKLIHAIFDKRTPKSHENHPQPKAAACTGVEDSLCLLKAYEKRERGGARQAVAAQSVRRLGAPNVVWVSYRAAPIFIKATELIASQRSLHFQPHHVHVDVPVFI
jgi:hypothetical protein